MRQGWLPHHEATAFQAVYSLLSGQVLQLRSQPRLAYPRLTRDGSQLSLPLG